MENLKDLIIKLDSKSFKTLTKKFMEENPMKKLTDGVWPQESIVPIYLFSLYVEFSILEIIEFKDKEKYLKKLRDGLDQLAKLSELNQLSNGISPLVINSTAHLEKIEYKPYQIGSVMLNLEELNRGYLRSEEEKTCLYDLCQTFCDVMNLIFTSGKLKLYRKLGKRKDIFDRKSSKHIPLNDLFKTTIFKIGPKIDLGDLKNLIKCIPNSHQFQRVPWIANLIEDEPLQFEIMQYLVLRYRDPRFIEEVKKGQKGEYGWYMAPGMIRKLNL
ncbi:MAG: hypothetical protein PHG05_04905 [Candidatus Nanoarchaeia archaeon]|nr:hypothetical protein [Candidatus Nanoarchaeia archaeon]